MSLKKDNNIEEMKKEINEVSFEINKNKEN